MTLLPRTEIDRVVLSDGGSGYSNTFPPAVYIAPSCASCIKAYATAQVDANGVVAGITMTQKGSVGARSLFLFRLLASLRAT